MNGMPGNDLLDVIRSAADTEWYRCIRRQGAKDGNERPPLTVWRFKESLPGLEELIQDAIQSFKGRVPWTMFKATRNWCIEPLQAKDFFRSRNFRGDVEASIAFGKEFPDIVIAAYQDLPGLAIHLRNCLMQQPAST